MMNGKMKLSENGQQSPWLRSKVSCFRLRMHAEAATHLH